MGTVPEVTQGVKLGSSIIIIIIIIIIIVFPSLAVKLGVLFKFS